ncbi:phosphotransferase [Streptosporangium sp. NPDC049078]|uniref:phosphotransferase n=1 Tax=Streptosporangium sp. NPDC049078 TaxID=3155767 RepID=UPI003417D51F
MNLKNDAALSPATVADVTAGWLSPILAADGVASPPTGVRVQPLGEGVGEMSQVARVHLDYGPSESGTGPDSVIVKLSSSLPKRIEMAVEMSTYKREFRFYETIGDDSPLRSPRCHHREIDDDGARFVLVMEDFPHHIPGDDVAGCTVEQAALALESVASLHARYWRTQDPVLHRTFARHDASHGPSIAAKVESGWATMIADFGDLLPERLRGMRDEYLAALRSLQTWLSEDATIVHGDFRLDNLMFGPPGHPDAFVALDWQGIMRAKGIQDVSYLVTHCMDTEVRRRHEQDLLGVYSAALGRHGVTYGLEQAWQEHRLATLLFFSYGVVVCGSLKTDNPRARRRAAGLVRRLGQTLLDHDSITLIDEINAKGV